MTPIGTKKPKQTKTRKIIEMFKKNHGKESSLKEIEARESFRNPKFNKIKQKLYEVFNNKINNRGSLNGNIKIRYSSLENMLRISKQMNWIYAVFKLSISSTFHKNSRRL
jgi:hypothetical protein